MRESYKQAKAQYECIVEAVRRFESDEGSDECPLSVQVSSDWSDPGSELIPGEYEILLCTGGPECRLTGDLDCHFQPHTARLQHRDWFETYQDYHKADEQVLLAYASRFFFG